MARKICVVFLSLIPLLLVCAQETEEEKKSSYIEIGITPAIDFPVFMEYDMLKVGPTFNADIRFPMPFWRPLYAEGGIGYRLLPVKAETSVSLLTATLGLGLRWEISPRFYLHGSAGGGGYYGFFNGTVTDPDGVPYSDTQGGGGFITAGINAGYYLTPYLSLTLGGGYGNYLGLTQNFRGTLGVNMHFGGFQKQVEIRDSDFDTVFPILYKTYIATAAGNAVISNNERFPLKDVTVSVFVPGFMDSPTTSDTIERLDPGESTDADLFLILLKDILTLNEDITVPAEISMSYRMNGRDRSHTVTEPVRIMNRNAMTWDDDRKAAAFVSPMDPEIQRFVKNVAGPIRAAGYNAVNLNFRMALGLFESLRVQGLYYVVDPNSPSFADSTEDRSVTDFINLPSETLSFRGGDCDDISITYASLLEGTGIDSAFITTPGHIFTAFKLEMDREIAERTFLNSEDLIFRDDEVWVPVEITMVREGFLAAWRKGAEQWRDAEKAGRAGFHPVAECWEIYESAGAEGEPDSVGEASTALLYQYYRDEIERFVIEQITPQVTKLEQLILTSPNPDVEQNKLGVLYARYGMFADAEEQFLGVLRGVPDHPSANMNLGNLKYMQEDFMAAEEYFLKALYKEPDNAAVHLALARLYHKQGSFARLNNHYARVETLKPTWARRYSYLSMDDTTTDRAGAEGDQEDLIWDD